ncbi:hypothetical protein GCM10007047_04500 [Cerasicoccus arenae]|uniref:Heparinase II/III-like C-terminal domain-containing protein n=2 Tax=Cerasicoccus arenae TaxID=424488 RepID=A0A8J3D9C2_9BACT|nr:hypothetical protein GCM10007047_04500 [Cerasicoccus arenae]
MSLALKGDTSVKAWLRSATLAVVRCSLDEWVGPWFRDHSSEPRQGHLETAHLSWAVAVVLDLQANIFSEEEQVEIREALREKGIGLCSRWLERNSQFMNWRCVLTGGVAVAAAVLGDESGIEQGITNYKQCVQMFQGDGSHGESLQYGNYAAYPLMLTWEALVRARPALASELPLAPMVHMPCWQATSLFYMKPLSGWGAMPMARSANFNDSGAIFRPSADLLLHWSARGKEDYPEDAGLARWLFDKTYTPVVDDGHHDRASFGFVNDFGFLSLSLIASAAEARSPEDVGLQLTEGFSCGDMITRDAWDGRTILAAHSAGDLLNGLGHTHQDLNSFILVHNRERMLVDPGHSCYRTLLHTQVEMRTNTHNTCQFELASSGKHIEQKFHARRRINHETGEIDDPIDRRGKRLLLARQGDVSVMAADVAAAYGGPILTYSRFWISCGTHALFIVDVIEANEPVKTKWNWLLNNRDEKLSYKPFPPNRLVVRRGTAGMKLFNLSGGVMQGPFHAHVHDAYHPLPNQLGEGASNSGVLMHFSETEFAEKRTSVHAIALDHYGSIGGWHIRIESDVDAVIEGPKAREVWKLNIASCDRFEFEETVSERAFICEKINDDWQLTTVRKSL